MPAIQSVKNTVIFYELSIPFINLPVAKLLV